MPTTVNNPRGYAFVSYLRAWRRMNGWGWFAAMTAEGETDFDDWVDDGLRMYDRMVFDIDETNADELRVLVGSIIRWMQQSLKASHTGRTSEVVTDCGSRRFVRRMVLNLDVPPPQKKGIKKPQTRAELILEPVDQFAAYDNHDELRYRIGRLSRLLTESQRRHLQILVDHPYHTLAERAEIAGCSKQSVDQAMYRIRRMARDAKI